MGDQFQYIKLPDGTYGKFAADATDDQIRSVLTRDFPQHFGASSPNAWLAGVAKPADPITAGDLQTIRTANDSRPLWRKVLGLPSTEPAAVAADSKDAAFQTQQAQEGFRDYYNNDLLGMYVKGSVGNIAEGTADVAHGQFAKGGHKILTGVGTGALPLAPAAAVVAPVPTGLAALSGYLSGKVGRTATKFLGGTEDQQDVAEDISNLVGGYGGAKIGNKIPLSKLPIVRNFMPASREDAIAAIRQAVNPVAADSRGFLSELNDQIDTIAKHGRDTGLMNKIAESKTPGQSLSALADIAESAATADTYYGKFIQPFEKTPVSTTRINGYGGETTGYNSATIGQLSQRLRTINATLTPRYVRGGGGTVTAQAAVNAEQAAAMQGEAEAIRNTIADEVSRRTGVPADEVKAARKNYGQLSDAADTARHYADQTLQQEFAKKNQPLTPADIVNPKGPILGVPLTNPVRNSLMEAFRYKGQGAPSATGSPSTVRPAVERRATPRPLADDLKPYYDTRFQEIRKAMSSTNDPKELAGLRTQLEALQSLMRTHSVAVAGGR